jgi:ATP-dependent DNA helicase PIF1
MILTKEQELALKYITNDENILLTGPAGTGKTALIKYFVKMQGMYRTIATTSTTGTSAILIGGTTLHSYLGILLGTGTVENLYDRISGSKLYTNRWTKLETLIIDEVSMLHPQLLDKLEELARKLRRNEHAFGGIQLVLSGDFLQLPCIGTDKFCFQSKSWEKCKFKIVNFKEIVRQSDPNFQKCLNFIRMGEINDFVKSILEPRVGLTLTNQYGIKPTKLYSKNVDVDKINDEELDKLAQDSRVFLKYEIKVIKYKFDADPEKIKKNCLAPYVLELCVGAQVMLLVNLDLANGLANGSRGVIREFINECPVVTFLNGQVRIIKQHNWEIEDNGVKIFDIYQIPLKVAYAISIHKSQGSSLDYAEVEIKNIFEYGQGYVALSRVKSLEGLSIISIDYNKILSHPKAIEFYKNIKNDE